MRSSLVLFLLFSLKFMALAQDDPNDSIAISGSVTDSVTGRGVSGAVVTLISGPSKAQFTELEAAIQSGKRAAASEFPKGANLSATTEEDGRFSFTLPETDFIMMQVSRTGYMAVPARTLSNGERSVQLRLVPLGVSEGRVTDANGEPLQGILVQLVRPSIEDGRRIFRITAAVGTDDRGQYRFWNLIPGLYYVRSLARFGINSTMGGAVPPPEADLAYPTVYFPGVPDRREATAVKVLPGQSTRADFKLESRKAYRVRGIVKDASSLTRIGVRLMQGGEAIGNRVAVDTSTGTFVIYGVTPGDYILQAFSNGTPSLALGEVPIIVKAEDLSGVTVAVSSGVAVRGRVEYLSTDKTATNDGSDPDPRQRRIPPVEAIILEPVRLPVAGTQPPAVVDREGNFTFADMLPGRYAFNIRGRLGELVSIRSGARDVMAEGLEVGTTTPEPLMITVSSGRGTIQGTIRGLPPGEYASVVLIRANGLSGVPTVTQSRRPRNSSDSQFEAFDLLPGDYALYAWPSTQQVEYRNPEALRLLSGKAVKVTLRDGGKEQVTLDLVNTEN
ncbi:MAG: carboxypeptidase-like regulatory domain-containing protein [Bryobacteraceae bacterium]